MQKKCKHFIAITSGPVFARLHTQEASHFKEKGGGSSDVSIPRGVSRELPVPFSSAQLVRGLNDGNEILEINVFINIEPGKHLTECRQQESSHATAPSRR